VTGEDPPAAPLAAVRDRRLLAVAALFLIPWTVVPSGANLALVFPWGLANTTPPGVTTLPDYLLLYTRGLPRHLRAWPVATVLHACALASAGAGTFRTGLEDRRVTGGLLALAGVSSLQVTLGLLGTGVVAVPLGTAAAWTVAWWFHAPAFRGLVGRRR
jgi:uncharacterized protein (TIGR04206 family)